MYECACRDGYALQSNGYSCKREYNLHICHRHSMIKAFGRARAEETTQDGLNEDEKRGGKEKSV